MIRYERGKMLALLTLLIASTAAIDPSNTPLNAWPMIMAHDAATTYLKGGVLHQINNWAKTQADGGAVKELECGARSFDWRPKLKDGELIAHHGSVEVAHAFEDSLDEMVGWCAKHNTTEDIVVLGITACDGGDACKEATKAALSARGVRYVTDCNELKGLTVAAAAEQARLPGGGSLLATFDCWVSNYVEEIACSGYGSTATGDLLLSDNDLIRLREDHADGLKLRGVEALTYTCYADSSTKDFPLNRMFRYLEGVTAAGAPSDGRLFTAQALWQETTASVVVGELHGSTLLLDESRSQLNAILTERIASGSWTGTFGLVEVNNASFLFPPLSHNRDARFHGRRL